MDTKERSVYVYVLIDPKTKEVRYVGTTVYPKMRERQHRSEYSYKQGRPTSKLTKRLRWFREMANRNERPILEVIEVCTPKTRGEREDWWIQHFRDKGADLTNSRTAGNRTY